MPSEEVRKEIEEVIKPGEFDSSWIGLRETLEKMHKVGDKEVVFIERHRTIYNWCAEFEVSSSKGAASPLIGKENENSGRLSDREGGNAGSPLGEGKGGRYPHFLHRLSGRQQEASFSEHSLLCPRSQVFKEMSGVVRNRYQ